MEFHNSQVYGSAGIDLNADGHSFEEVFAECKRRQDTLAGSSNAIWILNVTMMKIEVFRETPRVADEVACREAYERCRRAQQIVNRMLPEFEQLVTAHKNQIDHFVSALKVEIAGEK